MSRKKKIIIIAVSVLVLLAFGLGLAYKFGGSHFSSDDKNKAQIPATNKVKQVSKVYDTVTLPDKVFGLYLNADVDFAITDASTPKTVKNSIDTVLNYAVEKGFNTIYISAFSNKEPIIIKSGKEKLDVLNYTIKKAHENKIYVIGTLNYSDAINVKSNIFCNQDIIKKIAAYDIDSLMLTDIKSMNFANINYTPEEKIAASTSAISDIKYTLKSVNKNISFGVEVSPVWCHAANNASGSNTSNYCESYTDLQLDTLSWVKNKLVNYIYVDGDNSINTESAAYGTTSEWWNSAAQDTGVKLYAKNRIDLVCSDTGCWSNPDELSRQKRITDNLSNFKGNGFYYYSELIKDKGQSITRFFEYSTGTLSEEYVLRDLTITNQTSTKINTKESKISFVGTGDPTYPIYVNGAVVDRSDIGYFTVEKELNAGKNTFVFSHKGKTITYTVTYTLDVIKSVYPTDAVVGNGGLSFEIKAVAIKGSSVYAKINGTTVSMSEGGSSSGEDTVNMDGSDYVTFTGTYTLPAGTTKTLNLGNIVFYGSYKGHYDSMKGASVSVNATNYIGKWGVITKDYTECLESSNLDGKSNPLYSPLPIGTIDFIESAVSINGEGYYSLKSGRLVPQSSVAYESSTPTADNNLNITSSSSDSKGLNITIDTNWKVPVNATLNPQSYFKAYDARVFNVSGFTAQYMDVVFYYTVAGGGSIDCAGSNVISSAEWVNVGQNGTSTLRLYLRNAGNFYGYKISFNDAGDFVLTVRNKPSSLSNFTVMLDPGHGGKDPGALASIAGYNEKDINLLIAQKTSDILRNNYGINVIMTRDSDIFYSLDYRVAYSRSNQPDIFVAIHCDGSTSPSSNGTSAYYYKSYSYSLAASIHQQILSATGFNDKGTYFYPFRVARTEHCPSVLVECGFVSNPNECNSLIVNKDTVANAIATGIVNYFNNY